MGLVVAPGNELAVVRSSPVASLQEAVTELTRQVEDARWINVGESQAQRKNLEDENEQREDTVLKVRLARRRYPLAKQTAKLLITYVLGSGVNIRPNNKSKVLRIVDEFMNDPTNRAVFTSPEAQAEFLDTLQTDGEFFFVLFPDFDLGRLQLGVIDALNVADIVPSTRNWKVPLWYKVKPLDEVYDFQTGERSTPGADPSDPSKWLWYRDWRNAEPVPDGLTNLQPGLIYPVQINKRGLRGESEYAASLDWARVHRQFMEDRATMSRAAAQIAWKKKRKGPGSDVAQQVNQLQNNLFGAPTNSTVDAQGPPYASGSTIVENEGSSLEWVRTDTGAAGAQYDEKAFRMMFGSGVNVFARYYADPDSAGLSGGDMELPMLKNYQSWQKLMADVIKELIDIQLVVANVAGRIGARDNVLRYQDKPDDVAAPKAKDVLALAESERPSNDQYGDHRQYDTVTSPTERQRVDIARFAESAKHLRKVLDVYQEASPQMVDASQVPVKLEQPASVTRSETGESGAIDWYVDVDFPPIVERNISQMLIALRQLFELMPLSNVESQKVVVSMALTAFGFNDIDRMMDKLFPRDAKPHQLAPLVPPQAPRASGYGTGAEGTYSSTAGGGNHVGDHTPNGR